jgi:hypothetical protein
MPTAGRTTWENVSLTEEVNSSPSFGFTSSRTAWRDEDRDRLFPRFDAPPHETFVTLDTNSHQHAQRDIEDRLDHAFYGTEPSPVSGIPKGPTPRSPAVLGDPTPEPSAFGDDA